jgi:hypothetical protein
MRPRRANPLNICFIVVSFCLFFHWQIMHINMTGNVVREQLHLIFVMWCTMALNTIRDLAVRLMTRDTGNLTMFARSTLPLGLAAETFPGWILPARASTEKNVQTVRMIR